MDTSFSAVILASGLSARMGQQKAMLRWNESTTFIEKIIQEFANACVSPIICVINRETAGYCNTLAFSSDVRFIVNQHPERGRFHSVKTGLQEVLNSDFGFIHNVDNPFVSVDVIEKLLANRDPVAWCSPVCMNKSGHPVLVPGKIARKIVEVKDLNTSLSDFLELYPKIMVSVDDTTILTNINTPGDYKRYFPPGDY